MYVEEDGMKHHQKVYILFWLHFYSLLSFLSKLIVNTSSGKFHSWPHEMKWQTAKTDKVTFRLLVWVRSTDRSVCAETWVPSPGNPYIYVYIYICVHIYVCGCIHTYIHMCQYSKTHYLSSGFFCGDEILWLKATWEGTGLFCLSSWRDFRAGMGRGVGEQEVLQEAMEKCYLLACSPWLAQPAFL